MSDYLDPGLVTPRTPDDYRRELRGLLDRLKKEWPNAENELRFRGVLLKELSREDMIIVMKMKFTYMQKEIEDDALKSDAMIQSLIDTAANTRKRILGD